MGSGSAENLSIFDCMVRGGGSRQATGGKGLVATVLKDKPAPQARQSVFFLFVFVFFFFNHNYL